MPTPNTTLVYKQVNGCSIKADIFLPANENPPVVLFFHGGALISGTRKYLLGYQQRWLNRAGFAVAAFDYRLAPETKLPEIITDIQDALRWAKQDGASAFGFDGERMAVMGSSAGGYLSLMTGAFDVKPDAIVSLYGYGDLLGEWYTTPSAYYCSRKPISREEAESTVGGREKSTGGGSRYTYYFYCRQHGIWPENVIGLHPEADREKILRYCPIYNIGPDYPPALLLHGDLDNDVPYEQSVQMAAALEEKGIENHLITMQGAGHGFDGDGRKADVRRAFGQVVEFLQAHLMKK